MKRHDPKYRDTISARSHPAPEESRAGGWAAQLSASPRMQTQRRKIEKSFGSAAQRVSTPSHDNATGMPESLKAGMETLSGLDLSDVRVHRNSDRPAQLNALAFAQGKDIYLGPHQEQHLAHEAWHVVQQAQGRVHPTRQMMSATINDDPALEREADQMGERASSMGASIPEDLAAQRFATVHEESTVLEDSATVQHKSALAYLDPINQLAWDALWIQVGSYFDDSAKGWFDVAAKLMIPVPRGTEFGHGSDKKGGGSDRARSRFAQLQNDVWRAARMGGDMPDRRALAQLQPATRGVPAGLSLQPAAPGVAQLERYTWVIGGEQIDLDEKTSKTTTEELTRLYKNYFLPNRHNPNFRQFGIDVEAELISRRVEVPKPEPTIDWVTTAKGVQKYGLVNGRFYLPITAHNPAGKTHYPDFQGKTNTRALHVKMTTAGVEAMGRALQAINAGEATFLETDESFTNVYVQAGGVQWGLHLGEERQIFPIEGQGRPDLFDA